MVRIRRACLSVTAAVIGVSIGLGLAPPLLADTGTGTSTVLVAGSPAVFRGQLTVADKHVPLPSGAWYLVGLAHVPRRDPAAEPFGSLLNAVLIQAEGPTVTAAVVINANTIGVTRGWQFAAECTRTDVHFSELTGSDDSGTCFFVNHVVTAASDAGAAVAWRQALAAAAAAGLAVPETWVVGGFATADRSDVIDVRYYFNPEARGLPADRASVWSDSAWHRSRLHRDLARARFVETVATWGLGFRHFVRAGMRGRLAPDARRPMPWDLDRGALPAEIAERLFKLRALRDDGVLTEADYLAQSDLLLAGAIAEADDDTSSWLRALEKTITWRVIASADTLLLSYLMTGDVGTAGSIAVLEAVTKMGAYFVHEMIWDAVLDDDRVQANRIALDPAGIDDARGGTPAVPDWQRLMVSWLPRDWVPEGWAGGEHLPPAGAPPVRPHGPSAPGDLAPITAAAPQTPQHATPQHATPQHATPQHATPQHATPQHATPQLVTGRIPAAPGPDREADRTTEAAWRPASWFAAANPELARATAAE